MNLIDLHHRRIPDYYPYMYLDGYTPQEILQAVHQKMRHEYEEQKNKKKAENDVVNIRIKSEVKVK